MAAGVESIVSKWQSCAWNNQTYRRDRKLQVFPAAGTLEFIAMNVFGPFPEMTQYSQYIHFIKNHCSKLTRAMSTSKTMFTHIGKLFVDHWHVLYGIQRIYSPIAECCLQAHSLQLFAPCLVVNTSPLQRIIRKPSTSTRDIPRRSSLPFYITSQKTKEIGTPSYKH